MKAKEFLKTKKVFYGDAGFAADGEFGEDRVAEAMEEFHQQALQQCGVMRGQSPEPLPLPWAFVWDSVPKLIASNGATVCVLSTGTIDGAYSEDDILAVAQILRSGNGA